MMLSFNLTYVYRELNVVDDKLVIFPSFFINNILMIGLIVILFLYIILMCLVMKSLHRFLKIMKTFVILLQIKGKNILILEELLTRKTISMLKVQCPQKTCSQPMILLIILAQLRTHPSKEQVLLSLLILVLRKIQDFCIQDPNAQKKRKLSFWLFFMNSNISLLVPINI